MGFKLFHDKDLDLDIPTATIVKCLRKKKTRSFKLYQLQFELPD